MKSKQVANTHKKIKKNNNVQKILASCEITNYDINLFKTDILPKEINNKTIISNRDMHDNNHVDILNIELSEENGRFKLAHSEKDDFKLIKTNFKCLLDDINKNIEKRNEDTFLFCKKLIRLIHIIWENYNNKDVTKYRITGEWLTFLLLNKHIYDKTIVVYPESSCSKSAVQDFVCYLKNINFITTVNKITNTYNRDYIDVTFKIDDYQKNVLFYYSTPYTCSQINMISCSYEDGLNLCNDVHGFSNSYLDTLFYKRVTFINDVKHKNVFQMDCDDRREFCDKICEYNTFRNNGIKVSGFVPLIVNNVECCIEHEIVCCDSVKFNCGHYMCISDFRVFVSYQGSSYSKCPMCREDIVVDLIECNDIIKNMNDEDNEYNNDDLTSYFMTVNDGNNNDEESTIEHNAESDVDTDDSIADSINSND